MFGRLLPPPARAALVLAVWAFGAGQAGAAVPYETPARAAILIEAATDQVLFAKNADEPLPPASMSKLMTAYTVFERLKEGSLKLDDTFPVSEKAWRKQGSKMFVAVGSRVAVDDLLQGIIVQSGNDACIVVAEGLAGSEEAFAEQMTRRAHEIGLTRSTFRNASGWPDPQHLMSVRDLATLAKIIIDEFPEYYHYYGQDEFEYNGIRQRARNPLLTAGIGADGLKTGHTEEAGYGLVASAARDGRRLIMVIAGLSSAGARAREAERLLEYGYREFSLYPLFAAGDVVEEAAVWLGNRDSVPLVPERDVVLTLSREARRDLQVTVAYDGPVPAPVAAGARLADLVVTAPGMEPMTVPLVAGQTVAGASFYGRVTGALGYLLWGSS
ncbi:MAG TPA: D-alanyl-D-alanine carboxypeptidase family protein [Geminicoccaceae bacterium]|nr:D-alanyl-D-alanine carboxypeptidase family protein [Geminicoccaceae bacterium]